MITLHGDQMLTADQRSAILDEELFELVRKGGNVKARTTISAVVETGKPVNHVLHLLATVFMCGLWLPVWFLISAFGGTWSRTVTVDEHGEVHDTYQDSAAKSRRLLMWLLLGVTVLVIGAIVLHRG
jgi:hypothetical protein